MLALAVLPVDLHAESERPYDQYWREVWAGADVSANTWLVYSGATVAPFGHIHKDGIRLRAAAGYGQYSYEGYPAESKIFKADTAFVDVLAGYLKQWGPLTAKAFVGVSFIDHSITPFDPENFSIGEEFGVKGVIELWMNMGERTWSSLDISYTTAHETAAVRMRSGYRFTPSWSAGIEGGLNIDGQSRCKSHLVEPDGCRLNDNDVVPKTLFDYGRTGLFARYEWDGGEVSVSAGALGQVLTPGGKIDFEPYATVNWIVQF